MPNGGFQALPDSMVTKQLAQLLSLSNISAASKKQASDFSGGDTGKKNDSRRLLYSFNRMS